MPRSWTLAPLVLLLLAPSALAAEGAGSFTVQGRLTLPDFAQTDASPFALFLSDTTQPEGSEVHAPAVTVYRFRKTFLSPSVGDLTLPQVQSGLLAVETWTLHDLSAVPADGGNHSGYAGVYPGDGSHVRFTGAEETDAGAKAASGVEHRDGTTGGKPEDANYYVRVESPHVLLTGSGTVTYDGRGGLKVVGMDVELRAAENVTREETGARRTGPTEVTLTWLYLQFDAPATATLTGPVTLATSAPALVWNGPLRFTPMEGSLRTVEGTYAAAGAPAEMDGEFTGRLVPLSRETAHLELAGEVHGSSLTYAPAPPGATPGGLPTWAFLLMVAAVLVLGGGVIGGHALYARRRSRPPKPSGRANYPFTAEDCMRASEDCADREDWPQALEWAQRARRLAPTSGAAAAQEAWALDNLGDKAGAFAAYMEAARRLPTEPDLPFFAAKMARDLPDHAHEVEDLLKAALAREPGHAYVEMDFPEIARKPEWRKLLREASERDERDDEGETKP